uniref:Uncharacterized protein n=1 Tax=Sinocyclocheilus grahami TaxID=75366 RepID=A0A672PDB9_SINGR
MPLHDPSWTLEFYIDLALQLSGSAFTVGVAEEQCSVPAVTSTPEPCHKLAASPESPLISLSQVKSPLISLSQVKSPLISLSQVKSPLISLSQVKSPLISLSQVKLQLIVQSLVASQLSSQSHVRSQLSCLLHPYLQGPLFSISDWHRVWRIHRWCQHAQLRFPNQLTLALLFQN